MSVSSALSEPAPRRVPSYRHHKPTGQAVVTVDGHDIYLGKYRTNESRAEYDRLIDAGHSRKYVNKLVAIIPRMFKWAASEQLLPGTIYHELRTVEGLRKGRCEAPDHPPVLPVPAAIVEVTLPYLPPVVADMIRFQRWTGCRPDEVCLVRPIDVDTSGDVWSVPAPVAQDGVLRSPADHLHRSQGARRAPKVPAAREGILLLCAGGVRTRTAS